MGIIEKFYTSPELFEMLKHKAASIKEFDFEKSDIFSLGMIILEAATLHSV